MRTQSVLVAAAVGVVALLSLAQGAGAAVITYLNSERYVQALPQRVDATGFDDFNQSIEDFDIILGSRANIERATQISRLRSDRIIAQCSAETAAQFGSGANGAVSRCIVAFSLSEESPYRLDSGPVFFTTSGGGAQVSLRNLDTGVTVEFINSSPTSSRFGVLLPGTYQFIVTASASSLQFTQGPSAAFGALVLPGPSAAIVLACGIVWVPRRRFTFEA